MTCPGSHTDSRQSRHRIQYPDFTPTLKLPRESLSCPGPPTHSLTPVTLCRVSPRQHPHSTEHFRLLLSPLHSSFTTAPAMTNALGGLVGHREQPRVWGLLCAELWARVLPLFSDLMDALLHPSPPALCPHSVLSSVCLFCCWKAWTDLSAIRHLLLVPLNAESCFPSPRAGPPSRPCWESLAQSLLFHVHSTFM